MICHKSDYTMIYLNKVTSFNINKVLSTDLNSIASIFLQYMLYKELVLDTVIRNNTFSAC